MDDSSLKELGPTGYFISAMMTAIAGLSAAVAVQWRHANKVYSLRLAERDTLNDALTKSSASNLVLAESIRERNAVTAALADAVHALTVSNTMLHDRIGLMLDVHSRDAASQIDVIKSMAEAIRTQTGIVTNARDLSAGVMSGIAEIKLAVSRRNR